MVTEAQMIMLDVQEPVMFVFANQAHAFSSSRNFHQGNFQLQQLTINLWFTNLYSDRDSGARIV